MIAGKVLQSVGRMKSSTRLLCAGLVGLSLLGLLLWWWLSSSSSSSSAPHSAAEESHPNIVLIIVDTLRADHLGSYGHPAPSSPELDGLAKTGVRFDRVIAQSTWTRPSIGSMLTSLHPRTLGVWTEEDHALNPRHDTLAEILKRDGYWTAGVTGNPNINRVFNFDQGFDHYVDSDVLFPRLPGAREQRASGKRLKVARTRPLLLKALELARAKPEVPGFLQVVLMDVHEYAKIPKLVGPEYTALRPFARSAADLRYLKAIRYSSKEIKLFLHALLGTPGWENTLVVVTSDHGESLSGDHAGLANPKWHGHLVYEVQARVPWILFSTAGKLPAGRVVEQPVRLLDLMPTVLEVAGVQVPKGLAGRSLLPLLRDEAVELPEQFVVETRFRGRDKRALFGKEWIYIETRDGHAGTSPTALQRVGVTADGDRTSRANENGPVVDRMKAYLKAWSVRHPITEPTRVDIAPSSQTVEQLRALGYIE